MFQARIEYTIIAIKIKGAYAYMGSGYFSGAGTSDVKKIALSDGSISCFLRYRERTEHNGRGHSPGGRPDICRRLFAGATFNPPDTSTLHVLNADNMTLNKSVSIGGMPQAVASKLGNIYSSVISSYFNGTSGACQPDLDCQTPGSSSPVNLVISDKDPLSLCISDDGSTLYALCAGTGIGDGTISVITNLPDHPGVMTSVSLGFSSYGVIRMINGKVYFTSGNGLWMMDPATFSLLKVALPGRGLLDLQYDDYYLYVTGGYDDSYNVNNKAYVLRQSDNVTVNSNSVKYGMGAVYQ